MYFRYEIIDNDGKQYGLLTGLDLISDNEDIRDELMKNFDSYLPIPDFYYIKGKNKKRDVFAYFTEYGKERFSKDISRIIDFVKSKNFNIVCKEQTSVGTRRLVYKDKYQALIKNK